MALQGFSFQIGYCEVDDQLPGRSIPQYTLYLTVANEKERLDWIRAIRAGKLGPTIAKNNNENEEKPPGERSRRLQHTPQYTTKAC